MKLTKQEYKELQNALLSAFRHQDMLKQMVKFQLDQTLEDIIGGEDNSTRIFNLIQWAESYGKLRELITGAYEENPNNPELKSFYEKYLRAITTTSVKLESSTTLPENFNSCILSIKHTQLEEFLINIQKLQSIMIDVATGQASIQDCNSEYIELYQEITSQIEEFKYEGLLIDNPNNFNSLWEWYNYYKSNLSTSAYRGDCIHNLYKNICQQIELLLCENHITINSDEALNKELELNQIKKFKINLETLKEMMIEVATEGDTISLINHYEEKYTILYRKVVLKLFIFKFKNIQVVNPNNFRSLWQWYSYYSESLENTKDARRKYINDLYNKIIRIIDKALKQYCSKSAYSSEEFIQYLRQQFNKINSNISTNSTSIITNLKKDEPIVVHNPNELSVKQVSEPIKNKLLIKPNLTDNSLLRNTDYVSTWTDENFMNPEEFLSQQYTQSLISVLNGLALRFTEPTERRNFLQNSDISIDFISKIEFGKSSIVFAQSLTSEFKNYQISNNRLNYHPLVSLLEYFCGLSDIYGFRDQDVQLFKQLIEKGQENFNVLAARTNIARIESPQGKPIGTGVMIANNILLTCKHIFTKMQIQKAWVHFDYKIGSYKSNEDLLELEFIYEDDQLDYALLKIINFHLPQINISINKTEVLEKEQEIRTIHYPDGKPLIVSGLGHIKQIDEYSIDHNLKIDHASSGAPIFNRKWEMIAIHQGNVGIGRNFQSGITGGIPIRAIWNQIAPYIF